MTVFGSYQMLKPEMVEAIQGYIQDNAMFMKYETLADLTVLFTKYCSKQQNIRYFEENIDKIISNIPYANDEVFCKFEV